MKRAIVILTAVVALLFLDAHSAAAATSVTWTKPLQRGPGARIEDALVYDSVSNRTVMFGGYDLDWNRMNDIWEYNGATATWTDVTPPTGALPQRRSGHTMAFDPVRRVIIMFGGLTDSLTYLNDTWEWNTVSKTWTNVTGTPPTLLSGRQGARMVNDATNGNRMILVGGTDGNHFFPYSDPLDTAQDQTGTWAWNLTTRVWTQVNAVSSPLKAFAGRAFAGVGYNTLTGRVTVFGGIGFAPINGQPQNPVLNRNDIWELVGTTWTNITPAGGSPPGRGWTQLVYDKDLNRMVMFGGFSLAGFSYGDTWSFTGGTWTQIVPQGSFPQVRDSHGMVYDTSRMKMVVFGGYLPDVLQLTGNTWCCALGTHTDWPAAQDQHAMAFDTDRNVVFMYVGGSVESWEWNPATGIWIWNYPGPSGRTGATMAYERTPRKMLLFGGRQRVNGTVGSKLNETWEWNTATRAWANVSPGTSPVARDDHAMAYHAARNQTVLFGGRNAAGTALGDTWVWSGTTWTNVATPAGLTARFGHAMAYDAARGVVVLFGGQNAGGQKLNDVWEWNGAWQQKFPAVSPPARVYAALSSTNATTPGVAMFGGLGAAQLNDTWIWNGTTWRQAANAGGTAPTPRQRPAMVYDNASQRLVLYGGSDSRGISAELWTSTLVIANTPTISRAGDFDGDGKADVTIFRPSNGTWYVLQSSTNFTGAVSYVWGLSTDKPVPADYDGDGIIDIAIYRPSNGTWYILQSSTDFTSAVSYSWGLSGDIPVPGDYDGDRKTDVAIYRPANGTWYVLKSSTGSGLTIPNWGLSGDIPVARDYDGDGKTDIAIYRPSNGAWYILKSGTNFTAAAVYTWGLSADIPVAGDYDGDGKADVAIYRPSNGTWYILKSSTNFTAAVSYTWGFGADIPVPGDYDGDGKTDVAIFRPSSGVWYVLKSSTASQGTYTWGFSTDIPVLKRP